MALLLILILLVFPLAIAFFLQLPRFGKIPSGARLERIQQSPNYRNGAFQNISFTPTFTEGVTYTQAIKEMILEKKVRVTPSKPIPSQKTDLLNLPADQDLLVWFGHSSYFMQVDGKRFLVDPVFCGHASPFSFAIPAFAGADVYTVQDIPEIDYLLITHDHWDHLDHKTVMALNPRIKQVVCGLGVGAHLEYWGMDAAKITEKDWDETHELAPGFALHTVTGRHFSGRGLLRNKALWLSFVLQTPSLQIFIGGDSGYDRHFAEIGQKFGPFDLVILENGQYNHKWQQIHLLPEQILQVAVDLKAKRILPVHSGKFALASHPWDEPLTKITANNEALNLPVITPMIGELVQLTSNDQVFRRWWEEVD